MSVENQAPGIDINLVREKLLDGSIGAISIDTCIFTHAGYRLDQGELGKLAQFKDGTFCLVFSEVTLREVLRHMIDQANEAKNKFNTNLRNVSRIWGVQESVYEDIAQRVFDGVDPKAQAKKLLGEFLQRTGATLAAAKDWVDIQSLIEHYFKMKPPFESSKDKKSEFPDAIALFSLEAWSKKNCLDVLLVTADKGCMRYCQDSSHLYFVDKLGTALELIQELHEHRTQLCKQIDADIAAGKFPHLLDKIAEDVAGDIWSIDWIPEADSYCHYDPEMMDVGVIDVSLIPSDGTAGLHPVDYTQSHLSAKATVSLLVEAECGFTFSVKDGIDKDMVGVGGSVEKTRQRVKVDILLTIDNGNPEERKILSVELVPSTCTIDFGSVAPDYSSDYLED